LLLPGAGARIPVMHVLATLVVFQLLPLFIGASIAGRISSATAEKLMRVLHLVFLAAALVLVVLLWQKLANSVAGTYGYGHLLVILAIGLVSVAAGWFLGGPDDEYRRTLSIATLMRNIGLCLVIGAGDFAGSLVVPSVISYFLITFALSLPIRM